MKIDVVELSCNRAVDLYTGCMNSSNEVRNVEIAEMRREGHTLEVIGQAFGITRERVRQICKREGAFPSASTRPKKAQLQEAREARCLDKWGVTVEKYRQLRAMHPQWSKTPIGEYVSQRNNAKKRGIDWELTLGQWWDIWERSGKYEERGRAADEYCMTRFLDDGPYSADNVRIQSVSDNMAEYYQHSYPMRKKSWYSGLTNRNIFKAPHEFHEEYL